MAKTKNKVASHKRGMFDPIYWGDHKESFFSYAVWPILLAIMTGIAINIIPLLAIFGTWWRM